VQFGRERTLYQDPVYGIRELVDIGCQALSLAVNAPTTAVQVIDRLIDLLARIGGRPDPPGRYADDAGVVRLIVPEVAWEEVVVLAFAELRTFGAGSPQVTRRLAAAIDQIVAVVPDERKAPLYAQRTALVRAVKDRWSDEDQRSQAIQPDVLGLG